MMDLKVIVATHKRYDIPKRNYLYPVFAGATLSKEDLPYQRDDEGDNISDKNKTYCELTALYWAYKHIKADYIGLCHYRRYFDLSGTTEFDVILPKKRHYYIETVYDQFSHAHGSLGLDNMRKVLEECYPDYTKSFDMCMKRRSLHLYNMFIMEYSVFVDYCHFLFDVLEKTEEKTGNIDRLYGYLGERLLDVYIEKNKIRYQEVHVLNTEPTNWPKKIAEFLKRKFKHWAR